MFLEGRFGDDATCTRHLCSPQTYKESKCYFKQIVVHNTPYIEPNENIVAYKCEPSVLCMVG